MEKFLIFNFPNRLSVRKAGKEKKQRILHRFCQNVKSTLLSFSKADAKVELLETTNKYIKRFFKRNKKEIGKSLIQTGVVKHNIGNGHEQKEGGHLIIYART